MSLCVFHRFEKGVLHVWSQERLDDGPFHGLLEFPGGGVEPGETPVIAVLREVQEEVGITILERDLMFMGIYPVTMGPRKILLYVHLHPDIEQLAGKGHWLELPVSKDSSHLVGRIPPPNHEIIDDLLRFLKSQGGHTLKHSIESAKMPSDAK